MNITVILLLLIVPVAVSMATYLLIMHRLKIRGITKITDKVVGEELRIIAPVGGVILALLLAVSTIALLGLPFTSAEALFIYAIAITGILVMMLIKKLRTKTA